MIYCASFESNCAGHQEEFFHCKGGKDLESTAQGGGGVPTLGAVQGMTGKDIQWFSGSQSKGRLDVGSLFQL